MLRGFFGNLIFAMIAQILCGNHLNGFAIKLDFLCAVKVIENHRKKFARRGSIPGLTSQTVLHACL